MSIPRLYVVGGIAVLSGMIIVGNYFLSTHLWLFILAIVAFCITAPWTYYLRAKAKLGRSSSDDDILREAKLEQRIREVKNGKN